MESIKSETSRARSIGIKIPIKLIFDSKWQNLNQIQSNHKSNLSQLPRAHDIIHIKKIIHLPQNNINIISLLLFFVSEYCKIIYYFLILIISLYCVCFCIRKKTFLLPYEDIETNVILPYFAFPLWSKK